MTSASSRPASFHHLQNSEGINEIKPLLYISMLMLYLLVHIQILISGFYRGLGGNIFLQDRLCTGLTVQMLRTFVTSICLLKPHRGFVQGGETTDSNSDGMWLEYVKGNVSSIFNFFFSPLCLNRFWCMSKILKVKRPKSALTEVTSHYVSVLHTCLI